MSSTGLRALAEAGCESAGPASSSVHTSGPGRAAAPDKVPAEVALNAIKTAPPDGDAVLIVWLTDHVSMTRICVS